MRRFAGHKITSKTTHVESKTSISNIIAVLMPMISILTLLFPSLSQLWPVLRRSLHRLLQQSKSSVRKEGHMHRISGVLTSVVIAGKIINSRAEKQGRKEHRKKEESDNKHNLQKRRRNMVEQTFGLPG